MQTKTVNTIVREALLKKEYSLHSYLPFLHHALMCLDELALKVNLGENIKHSKLTINSYNRAVLSGSVAQVIKVYGLYGDREKEFMYNPNLTLNYNLSGNDKIAFEEDKSTMPGYDKGTSSSIVSQTASSQLPTIFYPDNNVKFEYNIDKVNSELVLGLGHGCSEVYITYLTNSVSKTSANLVDINVVPVIHSYISFAIAENDGSPQSKVAILKDDYINKKRMLPGMLSPLNYSQIFQILRS